MEEYLGEEGGGEFCASEGSSRRVFRRNKVLLPLISKNLTTREYLLYGVIVSLSGLRDGVVCRSSDLLAHAGCSKSPLHFSLRALEMRGIISRSKMTGDIYLSIESYRKACSSFSSILSFDDGEFLFLWRSGFSDRVKLLGLSYLFYGNFPSYSDFLSKWLFRTRCNYSNFSFDKECERIRLFFLRGSENATNSATRCAENAHEGIENAHECAENAHRCAENAHRCAENAHGCAENAHGCAENAHGCAENAHGCAENNTSCIEIRTPMVNKSLNNNTKIKTTTVTPDSFVDRESGLSGFKEKTSNVVYSDLPEQIILFLRMKYEEKFNVLPRDREVHLCFISVQTKLDEGYTSSLIIEIVLEAWERYRLRGDQAAFSLACAKLGFRDFYRRVLRSMERSGLGPEQIRKIFRDITDIHQLEKFAVGIRTGKIKNPLAYSSRVVSDSCPSSLGTRDEVPEIENKVHDGKKEEVCRNEKEGGFVSSREEEEIEEREGHGYSDEEIGPAIERAIVHFTKLKDDYAIKS